MNKVLNLFLFLLIFSIPTAFSGEPMPKGSVLEEDSYVFTIEEAKRLMAKIEKLEAEHEKSVKLLEEYRELDMNHRDQIREYQALVDLKNLEIGEYEYMTDFYRKRITRLERQNKFSNIEKWGYFGVGIGVTIASILVADKIDDYAEFSNSNTNTSAARLQVNFKF